VQPGAVEELAEGVLALLHNSENRRQWGQSGRERVKNNFTIQQTAVQVSAVLQNVLGK
jgi:glycosyltransferase involved in cell wall biosynthesis